MKHFRLYLLCLIAAIAAGEAGAQELAEVNYREGKTLQSFAFRTDQNVIIRISEDGKLLEWGNPWRLPGGHTPGKLETYPGRVEYYGNEYDSIFRGKVKSIGTTTIQYYPSSETAAKAGKVKFVGRTMLDYFDNYENTAYRGKLKSAGTTFLTWYPAYEDEAIRGKLKMLGSTSIAYYNSFDDKNIRGKLKSIGPYSFTWYTQTDSRGYPGTLKSGPQQVSLGNVLFQILLY